VDRLLLAPVRGVVVCEHREEARLETARGLTGHRLNSRACVMPTDGTCPIRLSRAACVVSPSTGSEPALLWRWARAALRR
jgi:hypothetical protein